MNEKNSFISVFVLNSRSLVSRVASPSLLEPKSSCCVLCAEVLRTRSLRKALPASRGGSRRSFSFTRREELALRKKISEDHSWSPSLSFLNIPPLCISAVPASASPRAAPPARCATTIRGSSRHSENSESNESNHHGQHESRLGRQSAQERGS